MQMCWMIPVGLLKSTGSEIRLKLHAHIVAYVDCMALLIALYLSQSIKKLFSHCVNEAEPLLQRFINILICFHIL